MKSARNRMDMTVAFREVGTYRGAAAMCGCDPKTIKRELARQAGDDGAERKERARNYDVVVETFRPGIGMIASRLGTSVVPVRLEGLQHVLGVGRRMARPGRVRVAFGAPLRLVGEDYEALAGQVEAAVKAL